MRKVGRRRERTLVVCRGFVRSRHETDFAAAAYGLVAPIRERELSLLSVSDGQIDQRSLAVGQSVRRRA